MSKSGAELRRAIRADLDASPGIDHLEIRRKYKTAEGIVESALTNTVSEWDALIAAMPEDAPREPRNTGKTPTPPVTTESPAGKEPEESDKPAAAAMPGLEQGVVKFARKPAKMGTDHIFWIPRVYIKNGLVDPGVEYDVYLKKRSKKQE